MDFAVGPEDTTTVIKMVKSLKDFLDKSPEPQHRYQENYNFSFDKDESSNSSVNKVPSFYTDSIANPSLSGRKRSLLTLSRDEKADMLYAKSKVSRLENEVKSLETEKKILQVETEKLRQLENYKKNKDYEECETLRKALKDLNNQKKEIEEELIDYKNKCKTISNNHENMKAQYTLERNKLEFQLRESKLSDSRHDTDIKEKCYRLERELSETSLSLREAEVHLKRFRDQQKEQGNIMVEYSELKFKCSQAEQKVKYLEEKLCKIDESALLMQKCQSELANYRKLEKENHKLREDNLLYRQSSDNALKLQEIIDMTSSKLQRTEEKLKSYQDIEFENQMLKSKLEKWESHDIYGQKNVARSPLELSRMIAELQKSQLMMAGKHGELEASVSFQKSTLEDKDCELSTLSNDITKLKVQNDILEEHCQKLQRRLTLITTERDGLRRVLSSYEREEGVERTNQNEQSQETINQYLNQVHQLEMQLSEARQEAAIQKTDYMKLQLELEQLKSASLIADTSVSNLAASQLTEIEQLKTMISELEEEKKVAIDDRDKYKYLYDARLLQGGFNPLTTKPCMLVDNPLQQKRKKFLEDNEAIANENKKLKEKLLKLQKEQADLADESMNLSRIIKSSKPMEDTVKQLQSEQLKNKRLKEQFSQTVKDFRWAILEILGYNIKQEGENKYVVRSSFSESRDDFFMFHLVQGEDDEIVSQLIETEFIQKWMKEFKEYIEEGDSIPGFLAAVTLQLFNENRLQQTTCE